MPLIDRSTMFHTVRYLAELTSLDVIVVGRLVVAGWEVIVQGPNPIRFDYSFVSDDDAKERGYQMVRDRLAAKGVTDVKAFDQLDWKRELGGSG